jgi:hypothetical protein
MKMETAHVSETSTLYIHTPGNYSKEDNIREAILFGNKNTLIHRKCPKLSIINKSYHTEAEFIGQTNVCPMHGKYVVFLSGKGYQVVFFVVVWLSSHLVTKETN